ncbi:MAG TPA: LuxR C-terminal-related transcriptional regulator [Pseudorhodoferax sp.]|nr:LuxR C-terminal-related transcriptional regulator [Pseudorhodoferax sp.]
MELHTQGRTMKSIAGELAISYQTVRKFVHT